MSKSSNTSLYSHSSSSFVPFHLRPYQRPPVSDDRPPPDKQQPFVDVEIVVRGLNHTSPTSAEAHANSLISDIRSRNPDIPELKVASASNNDDLDYVYVSFKDPALRLHPLETVRVKLNDIRGITASWRPSNGPDKTPSLYTRQPKIAASEFPHVVNQLDSLRAENRELRDYLTSITSQYQQIIQENATLNSTLSTALITINATAQLSVASSMFTQLRLQENSLKMQSMLSPSPNLQFRALNQLMELAPRIATAEEQVNHWSKAILSNQSPSTSF